VDRLTVKVRSQKVRDACLTVQFAFVANINFEYIIIFVQVYYTSKLEIGKVNLVNFIK
jgi:hypothetical protein